MQSFDQGQGWSAPEERHGGRCGEEPADGDEPQQAAVTPVGGPPGASPSNTPPENSQEGVVRYTKSSVNWDWLECGGIIDVSEADEKQFFVMDQKMSTALEENKPVELSLAGHSVLLYPRGVGGGKQARQTYRVEYGPAMLAFSFREAKDRFCANLYYKIPGTSCLIWGAWKIRELFHQMLASLGCRVVDEWPRRIDICLDLPGTDWRETIKPAIDQGCFVGTFTCQSDYQVNRVRTGSTMSSGQVKVRIYDKRKEYERQSPEYQVAMVMNRWGGLIPEAATRIELEIDGEWLRQREEMKTLDGVVKHIASVVEKLIGEWKNPFFRLTAAPVDRDNNHQSRAETHPVWREYRDYWHEGLGNPISPPKPLPRNMIDSKRAFACVKGYITGDAARRGVKVHSLEDAKNQLETMHENNWATDEDWRGAWEGKARRYGTLDDATDSPADNDSMEGGAPCPE